MTMPTTLCDFETRGSRIVCPRCDQPTLPGSLPLPIRRVCKPKPDAPPLTWNDLEAQGPCRYLGLVLRTVGCQLCGQKNKHVAIHACQHPDKQGDEVSQDRWTVAQMRENVCRTCKLFPSGAPAA